MAAKHRNFLIFHGVAKYNENQTINLEEENSELQRNFKNILKSKYGVVLKSKVKNIFR